MLPLTDKLPVIIVEPVTNKEPVISNESAFEENTVPVLPETEKLPVTPKDPVICVLPEIFVFVLTTNPVLGAIEAVALPLAICERFKPVIPEAGIPNKSAPEPEKLPEIPSVTVKLPVIETFPV